MYAKGIGVSKDNREAVKWYRKSAELGGAEAQYNLGMMYFKGDSVERDLKEARKWMLKAAEQGNSSAKHFLKELSAIDADD